MVLRLIKLLAPLVLQGFIKTQTCEHSAQLIQAPADFREWEELYGPNGIIESNKKYHDYNFEQYHMLYWKDFISHADKVAWDNKFNLKKYENGKLDFLRLSN